MDEQEALAKALYESGVANDGGRYADYYPNTEWDDLTEGVSEEWVRDAERMLARLHLSGWTLTPFAL